MKYKVGDRFLTEITDINKDAKFPYITTYGQCQEYHLDTMQQLVNGVDTYSYNKGAEDAWELTKLIIANYDKGGLKLTELREIFGTHNINNILVENTYQEARAKLDAYEKAKEEIKVGDIVYKKDNETVSAIVLNIDGHYCNIMWPDGSCGEWEKSLLRKTGENHADEVATFRGLLK